MNNQFRWMIYHPEQYSFDNSDRTEWYPNGVFNYNVSRMIRDLNEYLDKRPADEDKDHGIQLTEISIRDVVSDSFSIDEFPEEHLNEADLNRPVIYAEIAPGVYNLIDGNHRIARAYRDGISTLPAFYVPAEIALQYLGSNKEYSCYLEYWNGKVEDAWYDWLHQETASAATELLTEYMADPLAVWDRINSCLDLNRFVEVYDEGSWFTLFKLNGSVFCGEANDQSPSIKCKLPFKLDDSMIEDACDSFVDWTLDRYRKEIRKDIRHANVLMGCIRTFALSSEVWGNENAGN